MLWKKRFDFYKQELEIYNKRLEQLLNKDLNREAKARIEQFQNQFIRQNEVIDEMDHKINIHEACGM